MMTSSTAPSNPTKQRRAGQVNDMEYRNYASSKTDIYCTSSIGAVEALRHSFLNN